MLFFAWIADHTTEFDIAAHVREDMQVLAFSLKDEPGTVPTFRIEIPNPGITNLLTQPERYLIVSEGDLADPYIGRPTIAKEVCRGRVVGVPSELASDTVWLDFICAPPDEEDALKEWIDGYRRGEEEGYEPDLDPAAREDLDYYDPLFVGQSGKDDIETALGARPYQWYWDRRTLVPGITHILRHAEETIVSIDLDSHEGSWRMRLVDPPAAVSMMRVVASWTQEAKGVQSGLATEVTFDTYTWSDFLGQCPQPGAAIGENTGWTFHEFTAQDLGAPLLPDDIYIAFSGGKYPAGSVLSFMPHTIKVSYRAAYDFQQQREEVLDISMPSPLRPIIGDDRTEIVETIDLNQLTVDVNSQPWEAEDPETLEPRTYSVGDIVTNAGKTYQCLVSHTATATFRPFENGSQLWLLVERRAALKDRTMPRFFDSIRGKRALRHAVLRLAKKVMLRSRCLELTCDVGWEIASALDCGQSARVMHRHLPAGGVTGKIIGIELEHNGSGTRVGRIRVGLVPGEGVKLGAPALGQEQTGWEDYGKVLYKVSAEPVRAPINAAGLSIKSPSVFEVANAASQQRTAMFGAPDPEGVLARTPTTLTIGYTPLNEEDLISRKITVLCEPVDVPAGIVLPKPAAA